MCLFFKRFKFNFLHHWWWWKCHFTFQVKIVSISCQDSHNKSLSLAGPVPNSSDLEKGIFTVNGFKEYLVEQDLLIKQSPVLAEIVSSSQGKSNKVVLTDVKCATFEAFLDFCKTGYIQMHAIDEKMASFVYTYKTENLRQVLDKHVSMILNKGGYILWLSWKEKNPVNKGSEEVF